MNNNEIDELCSNCFYLSGMCELLSPISGVSYEFDRTPNANGGFGRVTTTVAFENYEYTIKVKNELTLMIEHSVSVQYIVETPYQKYKLKEEVLKLYLDRLL